MAYVRPWRPTDLPDLMRMAAITAWDITPADDKAHTTVAAVAANAQRNLLAVLQSPLGTAFVADEGGRPVGYLLIAIQEHDKTGQFHGYLADIYVEPAFRRAGLAKALYQAGEAYLRQVGMRRVTNWTHAHNQLGQAASSYLGLKLWGVLLAKRLPGGAPDAAGTAQAYHNG
jgi:GNAT superfamily N-acetyltransferase